jgi:hypothetical protein
MACDPDGICQNEPDGPPLPTPPPPNDPPPQPTEIFFTIQYKESSACTISSFTADSDTVIDFAYPRPVNLRFQLSGSYPWSIAVVNPTSGGVPVSPASGTGSSGIVGGGNIYSGQTYRLTCNGNVTKDLVIPVITPSASCAASPSNAVTGQNITWTAYTNTSNQPSGYSWSGTDGLSGSGNSVIKSYSSTGTKSGNITLSYGSRTFSGSCSAVVQTQPYPDLTAGSISPTAATVNSSTTYSTTITNNGSLPASGTITHLFRFDGDTDHNSVLATRTATTTNTIAATGGTAQVSAAYAFSSSGTKYAQVCADNDASFAGTVPEGPSGEDNNCGPWTTINISSIVVSGTDGVCGTTRNSCAAGDFQDRSDTTTLYRWDCLGRDGGANDYCSSAKTYQAKPELKAGAPTPTTATANTPLAFTAQIINEGDANASSFFNLFQVATSSSGTGRTDITPALMTSVLGYAAGSNTRNVSSSSYTFTANGNYWVRACADKSSAGDTTGMVSEHYEGDASNCSAWTQVVVGTTPPTGTVSGFHDQYSGNVASTQCRADGWAAYSLNRTQDLNVRILSDGTQVATALANTYRADLAQAARDGHPTVCTDGSCAFAIDLNGKISAGANHSITAQAQNPDTGTWTNLGSTPKTINCAASLPNLTTSNTAPTTATVGVPQTFTATITNQGGTSAAAFPYLFQASTGPDGTGTVYDVNSGTTGPIAAGASGPISFAYTTTAPGVYYLRACADKASASSTGIITESNEGDNCSPNWTSVTISGGTPTVTNVTISSASVIPDGSTPYTISVTGSNPGGGANITHEYALVNFQGANAAYRRGYVTWYYDSAYTGWNTYKDKMSCTGGGVAAIQPDYGIENIELSGCTTQVSGNNRTTTFTVAFNPVFTAPLTQNDISGYVVASGVVTGWVNFDLNFGLALKDLVAGVISPTSVNEGASVNYAATISNAGGAATGASFPYFFQVASQAGGGGTITDLASKTMTALAGGASGTASQAYTRPDAGTFSMRVCADKTSAAGGGVITESDENNNCGSPWTDITAAEDNDPEDNIPSTIGVNSVTISAPTVKTDGSHYNITVVGHRKSGGSLLNNQYALINMQGTNAGAYRGFITWYRLSDAWPTAQDKHTCSGVGGYAVVQNQAPNNVYGQQYIHLDSCNVSDSATGVTTAIFTVHFTPLFTSPAAGNDISGLVCDNATCTPWVNSDINFALDISSIQGVGGVCLAAHYGCATGTSTENVSGPSAWTWKCTGTVGTPAATCTEVCTEVKKKPTFEEN